MPPGEDGIYDTSVVVLKTEGLLPSAACDSILSKNLKLARLLCGEGIYTSAPGSVYLKAVLFSRFFELLPTLNELLRCGSKVSYFLSPEDGDTNALEGSDTSEGIYCAPPLLTGVEPGDVRSKM